MKASLRKTETRKVLLFGLFVVLVFAMLSLDRNARAAYVADDADAVLGMRSDTTAAVTALPADR